MLVLFCVVSILILPFKSKCWLEAENVALRDQVTVLRRQLGDRVYLRNLDRLFLVQLYHWFPSIRRDSPSFSRRPLLVGIERAFAAIGVGNHALEEGGRRSARSCAL